MKNLKRSADSPDSISTDLLEALKESIKEREMLLSLSQQIASVRKKEDLLPLLKEKLFEIGLSTELSIWLVNEEDKTFQSFILNPNPLGMRHPDYEWAKNTIHSYSDGLVERVLNSQIPLFFNLDELNVTREIPDYVRIIYESGFSEMIGVSLRNRNKTIGVFFIYSAGKHKITASQFLLIEGLANQLAIALCNMLGRSAILDRVRETAVLLELSQVFASVRNKMELLPVLRQQFKKIGFYTDLAISILHDNGQTSSGYLINWNKRRHKHPAYEYESITRHSIYDGIFDYTLKSKKPVSFCLSELINTGNAPSYIRFLHDRGIRHMINVPLRDQNTEIGVLHLFSRVTEKFTTQQLQLLHGMGQQLGTAVANIRINEAIEHQKQEKEMLLSISSDLAMIRGKGNLLPVIYDRLMKLFPFIHCEILLFNEKSGRFVPFLTDPVFDDSLDIRQQGSGPHFSPSVDKLLAKLLLADDPLVFSLDELITIDGSAISEVAGVGLFNDDGIFGSLIFYGDKTGVFNEDFLRVIRGVSTHFSIAVSNILSNEELLDRENEKTILLTLSNSLRSCRDKTEFIEILHNSLINLLHFQQFRIYTVDADRLNWSCWWKGADHHDRFAPDCEFSEEYQWLLVNGVPRNDLDSLNPVIIDLDEIIQGKRVHRDIPFHYNQSSRELLSGRLMAGNRTIGVINIFRTEKGNLSDQQLRVFRGICDQVSVGISNLGANDEIMEREREKSILLSLSNDLSRSASKITYADILRRNFTILFSFHDFMISLINEDKKTHSAWLDSISPEAVAETDYNKVSKDKHTINDGVFNQLLGKDRPVIFDMDELIKSRQIPEYIQLFYQHGCREILVGPLVVDNELIGALTLMLPVKNTLKAQQVRIFHGMCAQMAGSVSNFRSQEIIERASRRIKEQFDQISKYKSRLEDENSYLHEQIKLAYNYGEIVGSNPGLQHVFGLVSRVAPSDSTVILLGETGTGKELIARAIHSSSLRRDRLMVKVNCAALPASLIESELFGHERGSFTGAIGRRIGKFEMATRSTLFLDEIGEMAPELQVKLLRALQEKEIERVGGKSVIKVDVRIIAATNRDLLKEVEAGRFRSDLFYRLNVFPICLPPLRERPDDIPGLVSHFISKFSKKTGKKILNVSNSALQEMLGYAWPGNVRELEHLIERSMLMTSGTILRDVFLPHKSEPVNLITTVKGPETYEANEKAYILYVLRKTHGRISGPGGAAEIMNVVATTLHSKMKKLGISKNQF